jgi:PAS domain S-box-containing protein
MISEKRILHAGILIVDDQQSNVLLLEQMLRDAGYACIESTNDPYAVCELHRKNSYDLILLDLQMPGMDGFQVMECLKKIEMDDYTPVLVITAQPDHKLRALAAGAKDFVSKPIDLVEVQTRIHNMLEVRLLYKKLEHYNQALELHNQVLEQTVLKRTAELRESEARFRHLTELSSDWYWEQDKSGHFTKTFGPALEMLGIRIDDVMGNIRDDQGARWNEAERDILESNLAARRPFMDFVYSRTHQDGSMQYSMVSGAPMYDPSGCFIYYRGIGKDVTETMSQNCDSPAKL